jgi:hypothetical protein
MFPILFFITFMSAKIGNVDLSILDSEVRRLNVSVEEAKFVELSNSY